MRTPKESCHIIRKTIKEILRKETKYQDKLERRQMIKNVCQKNKVSEYHIRTIMGLNHYDDEIK